MGKYCINCGTHNKGEYKHGFVSEEFISNNNILSMLGIVFSFMIPAIGLGLSIGGLVYAKKHGDLGKSQAIAGIIISGTFMFLWFIGMILSVILQK